MALNKAAGRASKASANKTRSASKTPANKPAGKSGSSNASGKSAKKAPAKKTPAKKTPAKKAPAKKAPAKKAPAKKAPAKKAPAKKAPAKKAPAKKAPAKKAPAKKAPAKKAPARKKAPVKKRTASAKPAKKSSRRRRRRPAYLTPKVMRRLRDKLLERRKELIGAVASSAGDSRQTQSDGTEDYIDYAVSSYSKEFLLSLNELERKELGEVEDAIQRLNRGEFGYCQASGEEIPLKRLEVQPWARYSVRYQEMVDQGMLSQDLLERKGFESMNPLDAEVDDDWDDDDEPATAKDGDSEDADEASS